MKYCQKCGKEIMDQAVVCPNCGCATGKSAIANNPDDKANGGLIALSILIPIAGVILWPVKHSKTPKAARTYGLCGIISWVVYFIFLMMVGGY